MNMPNERIALYSLAFVFCLVCSACVPAASSTPPLTPITVQLAWTHQAQFAGMYAADQKGYYAAEGLAVTFVEAGSNVDKFTPLLEGTTQFGVGGADELIIHRAEGKPLKGIATIFRRSPIVFISLAEKGLTRPQDFAGLTVRISPNIAPTLHAMMAWIGVGSDQYTTVNLPSSVESFASGEVPVWGAFINSIVVAIEQAGHEINIVFPDDYGVHFYADTLFASDEMIATEPEMVLGFVRASLKGWTYVVENPAEAPALVQKYNPDAETAVETGRMIANLPLVNTGQDTIGWMQPEIWTEMENTLRAQGVFTGVLDVSQVYTMQFLNEIYER